VVPVASIACKARSLDAKHGTNRAAAHARNQALKPWPINEPRAIAQDRLHFENGLVTFTMKRVFSDGSHELRFTPQAFIRRIAMLVPAPGQTTRHTCNDLSLNLG
jgi:hypothetical protein